MSRLLSGLEPVETVLARLKKRMERRQDVQIDNPIDLNFRWVEAGVGQPEGRFYFTLDGKDMPLTDGAVKTAAARIDQKNPRWFQKFDDPDYFPKSFRNYNHKTGFMVRHDGNEIQAVLPDTYRVTNAYDLLVGDFLPLVTENFGALRGIGHEFDGDGDYDSFRIVGGDNLLASAGAADEIGQYLLFQLSMSENGLSDTKTWLGLYRPVSTTSALRGQTCSKWSHKVDGDKFFGRTSEMVRHTGYFNVRFTKIMGAMLAEPLPVDDQDQRMAAVDVLTILKQGRLITQNHYDNAKVYANGLTEAGTPHNTQYDLFCALTRGAQDLLNPHQKEKAEEASMLLFTERGGLLGQIQRALEKTPD